MVKILVKDSYLAVIKNAVNSRMFRNFYAEVDGEKKDILEDGALSCAFFVTNVLRTFDLISSGHVNVKSTIADMQKNGWELIEDLRVGAIIHWEATDFGKTGMHEHIGFYMGNDIAISNNTVLGHPIEHSYNYEGKRKILGLYWNNKLN